VRATFKRKLRKDWQHETGIMRAFVWALLIGGEVLPKHENPNQPGDLSEFDDESLRLIVEEGRSQVDRQSDRFRHATDRGQVLLTVDLALLGFLAALLHHLLQIGGQRETIAVAVWVLSGILAIIGTAAAAAVVVVKASFGVIDATRVTTFPPPVLRCLASEYARTVRDGELTADLRVTMFRQAARVTVVAAIVAAIAFGLSA
jgi:hypothetical protein